MRVSLLAVCRLVTLLSLLVGFAGPSSVLTAEGPQGGELAEATSPLVAAASKVFSLQECLDSALKNNHRRPASQFAVAMAEAQHRQALAGYWPQVNFEGGYQRLSRPMNFIFPASVMQIPAQSLTLPPGTATVTIPAGAFGPGFPPSAVQLPVSYPGQTVNTPALDYPIAWWFSKNPLTISRSSSWPTL